MKPNLITFSIVDDDINLGESIISYLENAGGFRCVSKYSTGEAALKNLAQDRPEVVLMDIKMKGLDGIECVHRLRSLMPKLQVIMLTTYEDTDLIFRALKAGANGYLLKRQPPKKLIEAVREVSEGGSPMSASIARKVIGMLRKPLPQPPEGFEPKAVLSEREQEVLNELAAGHLYKEVADHLGVSVHTVRSYVRRIYEKLHVHKPSEAVFKYYK